jgi:hypothetical protein
MREVRILPIGDIHFGADGCDLDRLRRHLRWGVKNDCYFLGMGDYLDVASPSNRKAIKSISGDLYDSVREMMDEKMAESTDSLARILAPTKGRWLGLVSGHHLWEFEDGSTTDTRLASKLETAYMGDGAAMAILHFVYKGHIHGYAKIWYHHGVGFGRTPTGRLNRLIGISQTFFAHIYLAGHSHAKVHDREPWIDVGMTPQGNIRWESTNRIRATTGGFLKGYEVGTKNAHGYPAASYVEKGAMPPTALGGVLLYIRPRAKEGRIEIDLGYQDG